MPEYAAAPALPELPLAWHAHRPEPVEPPFTPDEPDTTPTPEPDEPVAPPIGDPPPQPTQTPQAGRPRQQRMPR